MAFGKCLRERRKERDPAAVEESFKTTVNEEQKWRERLRESQAGVFVQCSPLHRLICFGPVLITRSLVFMCFCYICLAFYFVRTSLGQLSKDNSR